MAQVALARYMELPDAIPAHGKIYSFTVRHGVSLCMVDEADVEAILSLRRGCCGGRTRGLVHRATPSQIEAWNRP